MLISCTSCYSKYLINSADLKPDGRMVKCANCENQWYQDNDPINKENILSELNPFIDLDKQSTTKTSTPNLPATYVQEPKVSIFNSIAILISVLILIFIFWAYKKINMNSFVLLEFYVDEFYFNLQLIIKDIAKLIYKIIN